MKKTFPLILTVTIASLLIVSCSDRSDAQAPAIEFSAEQGSGSFVEHGIGEEQQAGFLAVNGVYFQAVDMKSREGDIQSGADYTMHIEADIAARENNLGFIPDQFVPGLTVEYMIIDQSDNSVQAEGTLMSTYASDGPHYGSNIMLNRAGTYTARFIIHSPAENNYYIHTDKDTKPGETLQDYWKDDKPLTVEFRDWVFDGRKVQPEYK